MSATAFGQKNIDCTDGACSPDFIPLDQVEKPFFSFIDVGSNNQDDIVISTQPNQTPRSLRIYLENNSLLDYHDLTLNLSASSSEANAADFMVIADMLENVNLSSNGHQGVDGLDASQICANKFKLGSNGGYGELAKAEFESKRAFNSSIDPNRCEFLDVDFLQQNNFTCAEDSFSEIDVNNPLVTVDRLKGKTRCLGLSFHDVCLSKTLEVSCTWKIKYLSPVEVAGQFSNDPADSETKTFKIPEGEWLEKKDRPGFKQYLCEVATSVPSDPPRSELLTNPTLDFNSDGWNLTNSFWINRKIKTQGDVSETTRPLVQQVVSTEPGRKYRVTGVWSKAVEDTWVSTGRLAAWSNPSKDAMLGMDEFYEGSQAIGDIHFNSSPTYYHYGYVSSVNGSKNQVFTIRNDDDREAISCDPPHLTGETQFFSIISDTCGSNNLGIGQSCSVTVRARPTSNGRKVAYLKRRCRDKYGDETTLNTKMEVQGYREYPRSGNVIVVNTSQQWNYCSNPPGGGGVSEGPCFSCGQGPYGYCFDEVSATYSDGRHWIFNGGNWQTWRVSNCSGGICTYNSPSASTCSCESFFGGPCSCTMGYVSDTPDTGLYIGSVPSAPAPRIFPLPNNTDISSANRKSSADLDFIFTATENETLIEYSPILRFHTGYINEVSVTEVSPNAGPSIPPVYDGAGNVQANVAGAEGSGYYELAADPTFDVTSPGFDPIFFRIPDESDWRIRYQGIGQQCPRHFEKIKLNHLASIIDFDDNDDLCDDVSAPEDPSGIVINWRSIGFDRLPEFGTESVQCRIDNCPLQSQVRDFEYNLDVLNPTSGVGGTQQGEGVLFVYDYESLSASSQNGAAGLPGDNDIPVIRNERVCAKIQDATTEGVSSAFAAEPVVQFQRHNWQALKVKEVQDVDLGPENNGKKIKVFKKLDSSARYLLKKEVL